MEQHKLVYERECVDGTTQPCFCDKTFERMHPPATEAPAPVPSHSFAWMLRDPLPLIKASTMSNLVHALLHATSHPDRDALFRAFETLSGKRRPALQALYLTMTCYEVTPTPLSVRVTTAIVTHELCVGTLLCTTSRRPHLAITAI